MSKESEKLRDFLKKCTDEKMKESVKKRIEILEKRETIYKDEKIGN